MEKRYGTDSRVGRIRSRTNSDQLRSGEDWSIPTMSGSYGVPVFMHDILPPIDETTSTMSVEASRRALEKASITANDLDLIIVATSTPDHHTPPVSSLVQHQLGAEDVPAFVIVTGCTGFVYALSTAYQFIETGAYENILIVGVELLSRFVDWSDRSTCVLFGDAAGAVVVQATEEPCGLSGFVLGSDGSQGEAIIMPDGGSAKPFSIDTLDNGGQYVYMNGRQVFKFAARVVGPACRSGACTGRPHHGRHRLDHSPPGQPAHHSGCGQEIWTYRSTASSSTSTNTPIRRPRRFRWRWPRIWTADASNPMTRCFWSLSAPD